MGDLLDLESKRKHIVLNVEKTGKTYVFPVGMIQDIIDEKLETSEVASWEDIMREILRQWLDYMELFAN